jgi:hypothetical protein
VLVVETHQQITRQVVAVALVAFITQPVNP